MSRLKKFPPADPVLSHSQKTGWMDNLKTLCLGRVRARPRDEVKTKCFHHFASTPLLFKYFMKITLSCESSGGPCLCLFQLVSSVVARQWLLSWALCAVRQESYPSVSACPSSFDPWPRGCDLVDPPAGRPCTECVCRPAAQAAWCRGAAAPVLQVQPLGRAAGPMNGRFRKGPPSGLFSRPGANPSP